MIKENQVIAIPLETEKASVYANRLGEIYISSVTTGSKKEKGQFFTPIEIANFMGEQISANSSSLSILDPGCGTAILSCCLIENIVKNKLLKTYISWLMKLTRK